MVPKFVIDLVCIPVAITAVTLYIVVIGIDTASHSVFGKVWREKVGCM
jgi:hypothetical protein